tara:strand:+ start:174 stop:398 length:225 start_codon:yes stop_codon:yes gene_type:complete
MISPISVASGGLLGGGSAITLASRGWISTLVLQAESYGGDARFNQISTQRILEDDKIIMKVIMEFMDRIANVVS